VRQLSKRFSGSAATRCSKRAIDVVVTDIVMPRMGGRDLAQRLLSDRPAMKVLYVSGYSEAAIQSHGMLGKNSAFIAKPFTPDDLRRSVRALLDARPPVGSSAGS
jgi:CheY-like chemotaxis protein